MSTNPFAPATKEQLRARLALAGPTGSGKTWTALEWATVLGERIAVIDTEHNSAALYADHFTFDTMDMTPPYDPRRAADALKAAEAHGYEVVILDSLTHFWQGEGGTLDIVDSAAQRMGGNKYAGWSIGTPALRHLVDTMLAVDLHLIVTMRSKMDYAEVIKDGRKTYERVGMQPIMRDGIEYEFTILGDIDLEHRLVISKSRCDALADKVVQPGRAADAAKEFRAWLESGTEPTLSKREAQNRILGAVDGDRDEARSVWLLEFPDVGERVPLVKLTDVLSALATVDRTVPTEDDGEDGDDE